MITFQQQETTDIRNRIWAKFYKYKQDLTWKSYHLRHRLRLFDTVATPTRNCASGTWTLTKEHERMVQSTQRKNAPLHHTNERKIEKTQSKDENKAKEEKAKQRKKKDGRDDEENQGSLKMKLKTGTAQTQNCDQDSDISIGSSR